MKEQNEDYIKGRGAQINTGSKFNKNQYVAEHIEGLDEPLISNSKTQIFEENAKKLVNKVDSPDLRALYSMNPYQGCEHGCIYCYARNTHEYYGFGAGLDFERKIIAKKNAAQLLEKQFRNKNWKALPIMLAGNTDCYQPLEKQMRITRSLLEVCLKFKHPVGIITKNSLILRDLDLLMELAKHKLVHVMVSITSLREETRRSMEPRTATAANRLRVIETLNANGVAAGVMVAPIVPGINSDEIPAIIKAAAEVGADQFGYTIVRLNGAIGDIFHDWLYKNYPDRADKVWNQICECHGGQVNDSRYGLRMKGEGKIAESIAQLFKTAVKKYKKEKDFEYNLNLFEVPNDNKQLSLFC